MVCIDVVCARPVIRLARQYNGGVLLWQLAECFIKKKIRVSASAEVGAYNVSVVDLALPRFDSVRQ